MLTGNKAGQYFDGGYSERATCRAEWLVSPPPAFSLADSMTIGTAGVTAAMCGARASPRAVRLVCTVPSDLSRAHLCPSARSALS